MSQAVDGNRAPKVLEHSGGEPKAEPSTLKQDQAKGTAESAGEGVVTRDEMMKLFGNALRVR